MVAQMAGCEAAVDRGGSSVLREQAGGVGGSPEDRGGMASTGLRYRVARTLGEVEQAWGLVYRAYLRAGLIRPNRWGLHTMAEAASDRTMVAVGRIGAVPVSTLSAYLDGEGGAGEGGLPLDKVYRPELDELRSAGRRLCEVGLFADRREQLTRSANSLFELMRFAFFYGKHHGADDIIIGVHPKHAPFYERLIAFDPIGEERSYDRVGGNPVVLLRLDIEAKSNAPKLQRGIRYFYEQPLELADFAERYGFSGPGLAGSALGDYLAGLGANGGER